MSIPEFAPPYSAPSSVVASLREQGFAVAPPAWVGDLAQVALDSLEAAASEWDDMPPDPYLKDGGHYRRRRHASFVVDAEGCHAVPARPHFQSPEYNALHGGMRRWFKPMRAELVGQTWWPALLRGLAEVCSQLSPAPRWFIEAHQFRIDTLEGIGRPTPEGAHRDGVDFVALFLIARKRIRGGETRVFSAHGPQGQRFTLSEPWSVLLLDDARMIHESTPIQPLPGALPDTPEDDAGYRDTLVLTFRKGGFQEAPEEQG